MMTLLLAAFISGALIGAVAPRALCIGVSSAALLAGGILASALSGMAFGATLAWLVASLAAHQTSFLIGAIFRAALADQRADSGTQAASNVTFTAGESGIDLETELERELEAVALASRRLAERAAEMRNADAAVALQAPRASTA